MVTTTQYLIKFKVQSRIVNLAHVTQQRQTTTIYNI